MTVVLETREAWYDAIYAFTVRGLTFKADDYDDRYTITLTGGY